MVLGVLLILHGNPSYRAGAPDARPRRYIRLPACVRHVRTVRAGGGRAARRADRPLSSRETEIVAIQQLLSAAQAGRFEFELAPAGVPVADELSAPDPISLPPIEMMPIGTSSSFE